AWPDVRGGRRARPGTADDAAEGLWIPAGDEDCRGGDRGNARAASRDRRHDAIAAPGRAEPESEGGMTRPVIITVAITGAVPRKKDNPAVPVTPAEQIESTHQAFEAGASLVHVHVRNPDESSSSDPELFAQVQEGIRKHCPGM